MGEYLDKSLIKRFCELISHQVSLQDIDKEKGRVLIPINKLMRVFKLDDLNDFPMLGIKAPLGKLLNLKPSLGLRLCGPYGSLSEDEEPRASDAESKVVMFKREDYFSKDIEGMSFDINIEEFEKAIRYYSEDHHLFPGKQGISMHEKPMLIIDFDYPLVWLSSDRQKHYRFRNLPKNNSLKLFKSLFKERVLSLSQLKQKTEYTKTTSLIRAISDLNRNLMNDLRIRHKIILHKEAGYHLNTKIFDFKEASFQAN